MPDEVEVPGQQQTTGAALTQNPKWEYKVINFDFAERWSQKRQRQEVENFQTRLNELGSEGWEMISYESVPMYGSFTGKLKGSAYLLFLKRRLASASP